MNRNNNCHQLFHQNVVIQDNWVDDPTDTGTDPKASLQEESPLQRYITTEAWACGAIWYISEHNDDDSTINNYRGGRGLGA